MFAAMAREQKGIMLAVATAVISGFAVFINGYGIRSWVGEGLASPTTYTTFKNLIAALVLLSIGLIATRRHSKEGLTRPTSGKQWMGLVAVAVVGGSVAFALFFEGFARASSGQAAFLHKTLIIWVAILAVGLLREKIRPIHFAVIGLLVVGQLFIFGGLSDFAFGTGEMMMLGATLLWSIEVVIAKKLLGSLSSMTVGVARMAGGVMLLVVWGVVSGGFAAMGQMGITQVGWVIATGLVLAGYVGTWYAALARAPAIDVTAVLVGGFIITASLNGLVLGKALPSTAGLGLVAAGVMLAVVAGMRHSVPKAVPAK
jgi:drug/metabolite transporter (DMT)-like permease